VRYVALGSGQWIDARQRDGVRDASAGESDFYEELLVNPTLLKLAGQRGDLDCGGLRYLIVAYGNFNQIVLQRSEGHVSVCIDRHADAPEPARRIGAIVEEHENQERP